MKVRPKRTWILASCLVLLAVFALGGDALPQGHSLRISLSWDQPATPNLDLRVLDPLGAEISPAAPRGDNGGQLDFDDRCDPVAQGGPENVSWPAGQAPQGEYQIKVSYTAACDQPTPTSWRVVILVDGQPTVLTGTINPEETLLITRFVVGPQAGALNRVTDTFPTPHQEDVPRQPLIVIGFARAMQPASAEGNVTLARYPQGDSVDFTSSWNAAHTTLLLQPEEALEGNARYRVTLGTSVVDEEGNRLALGSVLSLNPDDPGRYFFDFSTAPDRSAPRVVETYPLNNAQSVPRRPALMVRFSEPLHPNSIGSDSLFLSRGASGITPVSALAVWNGARDRVYLVPEGPLEPDQTYRLFVRASLTDRAGNPLHQGSLLERSALDGQTVYRLRFHTGP